MVSIKDRKILRQMFSHYDYVMTTAQLSKEKLYYRDIQRMLGAGLIEKVKRGYYHWTPYDKYLSGDLVNYELTDADIQKNLDEIGNLA